MSKKSSGSINASIMIRAVGKQAVCDETTSDQAENAFDRVSKLRNMMSAFWLTLVDLFF